MECPWSVIDIPSGKNFNEVTVRRPSPLTEVNRSYKCIQPQFIVGFGRVVFESRQTHPKSTHKSHTISLNYWIVTTVTVSEVTLHFLILITVESEPLRVPDMFLLLEWSNCKSH